MDAARSIFYGIYNCRDRSSTIDDLLQRLEFHPLSITLLAATATHNKWGYDRLVKEWNVRRVQVLRTDSNKSLAASLQLSLDSPTFLKLGPDARDLLGVIAFFPQGIDENNLEWLFPSFPDVESTLAKFCALSLAHRSECYVTMLAPIRGHLSPQDPTSSPLLCATKDHYFSRLSAPLSPGQPGFEEAGWIASEDVNLEHLFDVFTSIDVDAGYLWGACDRFLWHIYYHKPRKTVLGPKIEGLPDGHPWKPECLFRLSMLFERVGNKADRRRILTHVLTLNEQRGDRSGIARTLLLLSDANRWLDLYEEGIRQAKEALEIFEQLDDTENKIASLNNLALVLYDDNQLDAAEEAAFRTISLIPQRGQEYRFCGSRRYLGLIYTEKSEKAKAIHHFETAIDTASFIKSDDELFWNHFGLAELFLDRDELDKADMHIEQAKPYAVNSAYNMAHAMEVRAQIFHQQDRPEDAKLEISRALEIFEKCGATGEASRCTDFLQEVNE